MTTAQEIAQRIARTQLPGKPAWLETFEALHAVEFTDHSDYRPGVPYGVWGASITEAKARELCAAYGVELGEHGAGLEYKRFSIVRDRGWLVCAYQRDEG